MVRATVSNPSFFHRLWLAIVAFWRAIASPAFAAQVRDWPSGLALPAPEPREAAPPAEAPPAEAPPPKAPPPVERANEDAALQLLALFQREGRLVDFLEEDVAGFSDEDIGAAARVVHTGCRRALDEHFELVPVRTESEGDSVTLGADFDASAVRLTGNVVGEPPFRGTLQHRGWRAEKVTLPKLAAEHDARVIAAAEVEL